MGEPGGDLGGLTATGCRVRSVNRPGFDGGWVLPAWGREVIVVVGEEFVNGDGFVAAGTVPAEADSGAGSDAVGAPLLAEVALLAFAAGVDGHVAAVSRSGSDGDGGCGEQLLAASGAPGGLAAGRRAVALAPDAGEAGAADRAAGRREV